MSYICKVDVTSNNMKHAQIALNAWNYGTVVQEDVEELKLSIANDIVVQVRGEDDGARTMGRGRGDGEARKKDKEGRASPVPGLSRFPGATVFWVCMRACMWYPCERIVVLE